MSMSKMTQKRRILRYLETHKRGITPMDALNLFGCMRLGARIYDLKEEGHDIYRVMEYKDDGSAKWARYFLRGVK